MVVFREDDISKGDRVVQYW